ncbi:large subunit ribosomal protein LP1 [Nematocida sp. AWRm80]|nr:large subunit ribosomal protein LP1 [Nematocida sp. AWRm80]
MIEQKELCVLSILLLQSTGLDVSVEGINKIATHVGVKVDSYLPELFSKVTKERLEELIKNPSGGSVSQNTAAASEEVKEEKKEESEEEDEGSDDFELF